MSESSSNQDGPALPVARPVTRALPVARPLTDVAPGWPAEASADPGKESALLLRSSSGRAALLDVLMMILLIVLLELAIATVLGAVSGGDRFVTDADAGGVPDGPTDADEPGRDAIPKEWFVPLIGMRGAGAILIIVGIVTFRGQSLASIGLHVRRLPLEAVSGVGACLSAYVAMFSTSALLMYFFPEAMQQMQENTETLMGIVPRLSLLGFFGLAALIGVYEEVLFRGFLMTRLRRVTTSWVAAVLISTALFTALHAVEQTPVALLWITMLSLIFSGVTIWRRSIVPAIVAHALFDFTQFLGMAWQAGDLWT